MAFASPEEKFGLKLRGRARTPEQNFSMILGSVYIVGGIIGFFISGFANITEMTNHELFGVFLINPYHNIVHIVIGGFWLLGAFTLTPVGNEGLNLSIGVIYALATVIGWLGYLSLLSIPPGPVGDQWLHLVTAVVTLIFGTGLISAGRRQAVTA
ncbi:MAG TPA: DUF4383 domain-containing protein [Pseudonocardiaceae bacterium]|jgi:hypothetical protein|nr:DUF4383 domain-containing protein [Pseudonocardiaceae bacterium]